MRTDIAESIRHDVVTDDQYILEVVPFYDERWATDEPMTLEELAAWIGQPDLKTPMSQNLVDALGGWFVYDSDRKELSEDQVQALWRWYTESPVTGSDPDAVTVYDGDAVDEDEDDWDSAALVVHRNPIPYTEETVAEYARITLDVSAVTLHKASDWLSNRMEELAANRKSDCHVMPASVREKFAARIAGLNEELESLPQKQPYRLVREPSYHATTGAPRAKFVLRIAGVDDSCVRLFSPLMQPGDDEVVFDVEVSAKHSVAELAEIAAAEFERRFGLPTGSAALDDEG
ncbi:hypothetical protein [Rothia mucilaginosa]|jgi:hypothetical protein|uniref:hypothetical protein n=1 Tax=Rothia mucilaginosa TaxID=43675 RepID=UPI0026F12BE5|nr:hypothetical protein [Rothia mucilaginosa]